MFWLSASVSCLQHGQVTTGKHISFVDAFYHERSYAKAICKNVFVWYTEYIIQLVYFITGEYSRPFSAHLEKTVNFKCVFVLKVNFVILKCTQPHRSLR